MSKPLEVTIVNPKLTTAETVGRLLGVMTFLPLIGGAALMLALPLASEVFGLSDKSAPGYWRCVAFILLVRSVVAAVGIRPIPNTASS